MLYATILHTLAGVVTGSVFKIRTLALWLIVVPAEALTLTTVGIQVAMLWAAVNLIAIQAGYCAGALTRLTIEQSGYSIARARMRQ